MALDNILKYLQQIERRLSDVQNAVDGVMTRALTEAAERTVSRTKLRTPVNTGHARRNWRHDGARKRGSTYEVTVYNPVEYAVYLEYGFRAHFVPGYWAGKEFVYDPHAKGGMYVGKPGGWVQGHFMLHRSLGETDAELPSIVERHLTTFLTRLLGGGRE